MVMVVKLKLSYYGIFICISPWNFPVVLTFGPLGSIFAAGNRVMIKPSEFTPRTSDLMNKGNIEVGCNEIGEKILQAI